MKKLPVCALGLIFLTGCASYSAVMMGPTGDAMRCSGAGAGLIGVALASSTFNQCNEDLKRMGYLPMEEAGYVGVVFPLEAKPGEEIVVGRVLADSPAEKAGIKGGDVIAKIDGQAPSGGKDCANLMFGRKDTTVRLDVKRGGETSSYAILRGSRAAQLGSRNADAPAKGTSLVGTSPD